MSSSINILLKYSLKLVFLHLTKQLQRIYDQNHSSRRKHQGI